MKGIWWNLFFWSVSSPWWKNMIGMKPSAVTWLKRTLQTLEIMLTQHFSPKKVWRRQFFSKTVFRFGFYVLKLVKIHVFANFQIFWDFRPIIKWTTSFATATHVLACLGMLMKNCLIESYSFVRHYLHTKEITCSTFSSCVFRGCFCIVIYPL